MQAEFGTSFAGCRVSKKICFSSFCLGIFHTMEGTAFLQHETQFNKRKPCFTHFILLSPHIFCKLHWIHCYFVQGWVGSVLNCFHNGLSTSHLSFLRFPHSVQVYLLSQGFDETSAHEGELSDSWAVLARGKLWALFRLLTSGKSI